MTLLNKLLFSVSLAAAVFVCDGSAQTVENDSARKNFGYSQNPKRKNKPADGETGKQNIQIPANQSKTVRAAPENKITGTDSADISAKPETTANYSAASETFKIAGRAKSAAAASPTEIYKIGVGDVLFISLQNAPSKASTYFTVLNDGTIDYPLANEMVAVAGLTDDEIAELLEAKVKLYENPRISVKVREHASHSITVLGAVEKSGEKFLQREAIPLYVIKAEAVADARASRLSIKRAGGASENLDLNDSKNENVLIFPGDILEFKFADARTANSNFAQFYYIGGEISLAGQKDFHAGITLTQAILASGGLRKQSVKKVIIRRVNEQGLLSPIQFDLSAIKDGKQPDPVLQAGDTIEIVK